MSSSTKALVSVLPTARRHSTLFSSSTRYHKLLALATIALLALAAVTPANAADIPPQHRRHYKSTRRLAHENENVKREPVARPDQAFSIPRLQKRGINSPSDNDKYNINTSNWAKYFSDISNFIQWWMVNYKSNPFSADNGNTNKNGNGNGNGNGGNGNNANNGKQATPTTPVRTIATPAATTRAQAITGATTTHASALTPAASSPSSPSPALGTSAAAQTSPASGSNSALYSNASKPSVAIENGPGNADDDGSNSLINGSSPKTSTTNTSIGVPSSSTTGGDPTDQGAESANSNPDRKWIIGLVIGLLLLSFTCCGLGYLFFRRRRARQRQHEQTSTTSSEVHIVEKGQEPGMVHTLAPPPTIPLLPPVTLAALPPIPPIPPPIPPIPAAAVAPMDNRRDSRRASRMSTANTRSTTPSSYFSSEFSEKSLFHYEPDPNVGVPVDYPIAIHVPPRVAKALAKRDAARLASEQLERELERTRAMYLQPGPSRVTHASDGSSGTRNTDGHGSYFGLPPTGYNRNQIPGGSGTAESSNAPSVGHHDPYSDTNRWSGASSRLSGTIPVHESFPLPPEPSPTPRSATFRLDSMPAIASVLSGDPSDDRVQRRVSHPLPPIPQQEDDPFRDSDAPVAPSDSTHFHNPFNAGRASQGSLTTDESTNAAGGGSSQGAHVVSAVTATARVTPAARVVYSTASSSSNGTILPDNRGSDASMAPTTAVGPNTDTNPFGDQHQLPMRSQVAYAGVVMTGEEEAIDGHAADQHHGSQTASQGSFTTAPQPPSTPSTPSTTHTFG